jgi:hypothetical protein
LINRQGKLSGFAGFILSSRKLAAGGPPVFPGKNAGGGLAVIGN